MFLFASLVGCGKQCGKEVCQEESEKYKLHNVQALVEHSHGGARALARGLPVGVRTREHELRSQPENDLLPDIICKSFG